MSTMMTMNTSALSQLSVPGWRMYFVTALHMCSSKTKSNLDIWIVQKINLSTYCLMSNNKSQDGKNPESCGGETQEQCLILLTWHLGRLIWTSVCLFTLRWSDYCWSITNKSLFIHLQVGEANKYVPPSRDVETGIWARFTSQKCGFETWARRFSLDLVDKYAYLVKILNAKFTYLATTDTALFKCCVVLNDVCIGFMASYWQKWI